MRYKTEQAVNIQPMHTDLHSQNVKYENVQCGKFSPPTLKFVMKRLVFLTLLAGIAACHTLPEEPQNQVPQETAATIGNTCSLATLTQIERQVSSQDALGHGPDIGSVEWASSIEHRLGIKEHNNKPPMLSAAWCGYIEQLHSNSPSFACVEPLSQVESAICASPELAALDNKLADIFKRALQSVNGTDAATLKAVQRGWAKGRDECWKSDNLDACTRSSYQQRIDEIQLEYSLLSPTSTQAFQCGEDRVDVQFFSTTPEKILVKKGTLRWLMHRLESASGAKYQGRNEMFWLKGDTAIAQWQFEGQTFSCTKI
ncbi:MliC family protein [Pseudoalteromonas sp. YIC-656]|uniref:MliC family protein n=1 Tax=Pseudoalteromonas pernae TaxID=3118054 RepID=UPI003242D2ED